MNKRFITKRVTIKNFKTQFNDIINEYNLDIESSKVSYNVKNNSGNLIQGNGFKELILPNSQTNNGRTRKLTYTADLTFKKMWRYSYYSKYNERQEYLLVCLGSDNKIYFLNLFSSTRKLMPLNDYVFNAEPTAMQFRINGDEVIGFVSPKDSILVWNSDNDPYSVITAPKFQSMCYHNNRLFAIDNEKKYLVRYSSMLNPLDWTSPVATTSGGTIELNDYKGELKSLISFLDNIYIFRDFGISKINTSIHNGEFSATNIYNSSCKIYCNTACICGTDIFFLAEDGIYKFDGFNVKKLDLKFSSSFINQTQSGATSCFYEGKLYIACSLNFFDQNSVGIESVSHTNNSLIELDILTEEYNITRGVDIISMLPIKDLYVTKLIICMNAGNGNKLWQLEQDSKFGTSILPKKWQSGKINFGFYDKQKILKEVNLICKSNCILRASNDENSKTFNIKASDKMQRIRINFKGKNLSLSFESEEGDLFISSPQFLFALEE